jgi:zinc protease
VRASVFTGAERTVTTLKLVLRLYRQLMKNGLTPERVRFFQSFLAGSYASDMDAPERRLSQRVTAELEGLPDDFVDTYVKRLEAVTPEQVSAAVKANVKADNVVITMVATADTLLRLLVKSGIDPIAIDVVKYDSF